MENVVKEQCSCFKTFHRDVENIPLPDRFTFPFYYEPHPLSVIAAEELQDFLEEQNLGHNFGMQEGQDGLVIGKMFGVLVVQNQSGTLGYLAAFSGKLAGSNHHPGFVPPVFDILEQNSFFLQEEEQLNVINRRIEELEADSDYLQLLEKYQSESETLRQEIDDFRAFMIDRKRMRKKRREESREMLSDLEFEQLLEELKQESLKYQWDLKFLMNKSNIRINEIESELGRFTREISDLKEERKRRSGLLQQRVFDNYYFLNKAGEMKSLGEIFSSVQDAKPPAGAGECAAPKLLHYAFTHNLKPIALAEFWWGEAPKSEIRKHKQFYPACRGKCEPILGHMLKGIELDENPMLSNPAEGKELEIIHEDEAIIIVNKPPEFLSVPGKNIKDSVYQRIGTMFPDASGPLIVHRLDMSTSGLMVLAKTKSAHKNLQRQFLKHQVEKRYLALLDGILNENKGFIDLPLRLDLDDRPKQLVCFEHGKPAQTRWELVELRNGKSLIRFYPITGRTHQLRVHAAHPLGLNTPIVGDDLYGQKKNRLHLHAEYIEFNHPASKERIYFKLLPTF